MVLHRTICMIRLIWTCRLRNCMIRFLKDQVSSMSSELYEEILKPNKSHTNRIIQIFPCKIALIQLEKDLYSRIYKRERFAYIWIYLTIFAAAFPSGFFSMLCDFVYNTMASFTIQWYNADIILVLMSLIILFSSSVSHVFCWHDVLLNWWTIIRRL